MSRSIRAYAHCIIMLLVLSTGCYSCREQMKNGLEVRKGMIAKQAMQSDGFVRTARIEVYPEYVEEYLLYAKEVGEISLRTEAGVLTMYALVEEKNPCVFTVLETYSSQEAYRLHVASSHFQKYKKETLHMIKSLDLTDQKTISSSNKIINVIED